MPEIRLHCNCSKTAEAAQIRLAIYNTFHGINHQEKGKNIAFPTFSPCNVCTTECAYVHFEKLLYYIKWECARTRKLQLLWLADIQLFDLHINSCGFRGEFTVLSGQIDPATASRHSIQFQSINGLPIWTLTKTCLLAL